MTRAILLLWAGLASSAHAAEPIPADAARVVFTEADALCTRDAGRLWGMSLCGPIMLVDPQSRTIVANVADDGGLLEPQDGVFVGILPNDRNAANTAVEWSGTRWTQMLWPLPDDPGKRAVLVSHELFHNLQPKLSVGLPSADDNSHLDTLDGRYWLQMEWRALARALRAKDVESRRDAVFDALAFRERRQTASAGAERNETALELNEGLAAYTGIAIAAESDKQRLELALQDLQAHVADASFVRSFAYATGPAYGLLLDRYMPGWREGLDGGVALPTLLARVVGYRSGSEIGRAQAATSRYDKGQELRQSELARENARLERLAEHRRRFVEGPVLTLVFENMNIQFDPRTLQPLDDVGTVYPALRITDEWGVLQVDGGALLKKDWSAVVVTAPAVGQAATYLQGDGWKLDLAADWRLVPGERTGDYVIAKALP
jgi:hypothetical protein